MEVRRHSLIGPILSVQPLTPPRSSSHSPSHHHPLTSPCAHNTSSEVSRKVAACKDALCDDKTQFDTLIESFHEWLAQHPSPDKHNYTVTAIIHTESNVCRSGARVSGSDAVTHFSSGCEPLLGGSTHSTLTPPLMNQLAAQHTTPNSGTNCCHRAKLLHWGIQALLNNVHSGREMMEVGVAHHRLSMLSRVLRLWGKELNCRRETTELAEKFYINSTVRKTFNLWRLHIYHCSLTRLCDMYTHDRETTTMQAALHIWIQRVCVLAGERLLLKRLHSLWRNRLLRKVLYSWVTLTKWSKSVQLERKLDSVRLRHHLERWRLAVRQRSLAHHLHTSTLLTNTLHSWRGSCLRAMLLKQACRAREYTILLTCFKKWRKFYRKRLMWRHWCMWRRLVFRKQAQREKLSLLQCYFNAWREHLCNTLAELRRDQLLLHRYFRWWKELTEWSYTQTALNFVARLQLLLSSDPVVSYSSMAHSLTSASRNLGLGAVEIEENCHFNSNSLSHNQLSYKLSTPCPRSCGCLDPNMARDIAKIKQRLSDLSHTLNDASAKESRGCVNCDPLKSTPPSNSTLATEMPPIIAMATQSIQRLRLQPCSKAFNRWKMCVLEWDLEHVQSSLKCLLIRRMFDCWRRYNTLCVQLEKQALTLWRVQRLSRVWGRWRKSLIRESISRKAVHQSRQLLLQQAFTTWQVASSLCS